MQKLLFLLLLLLLTATANAQLRVLFVDDSGDGFGNAEYLASSLDSLGYDFVYIDAIGQAYSPTASEMSDFDLVIWYTSTWGLGLQLWNGEDSTNAGIAEYLSQPNANFWLIGLDYFFDRYGTAPVSFQSGDFAYDYLGISKYAVQSYADDGSIGVPLVTPAPGQPITGLTDIDWQFSTLWYADGFDLRPEASPVYLFGGSGYALNGTPTGVWYQPPGGASILTYGFDLALASNFSQLRAHMGTVLNWWENKLSATTTLNPMVASVKIAPNTFSDHLEIQVKTVQTCPVSVRLYNSLGQIVAVIGDQVTLQAGEDKVYQWEAASDLPNGLYYCTVQSGQHVSTTTLVKQAP